MSDDARPPHAYGQFVSRFPHLGEAWESARKAEAAGPLDEKARRLIKLAIAVGAMREGAVHSAARKALRAGATNDELYQVVACAASTIGLPSAVANFTWPPAWE